MKIEYGILNVKTNQLIREGFSKDQAESFLSVHLSDCLDDKKKPSLRIVTREIGEYK